MTFLQKFFLLRKRGYEQTKKTKKLLLRRTKNKVQNQTQLHGLRAEIGHGLEMKLLGTPTEELVLSPADFWSHSNQHLHLLKLPARANKLFPISMRHRGLPLPLLPIILCMF